MKKVKSFSLVEVLVAVSIFAVVISLSVASFGMIRISNEKTDDLRVTQECSRQLEGFVSSAVRTGLYGKRIMGINGEKKLANIGLYATKEPAAQETQNYLGVVVFDSDNSARAFFKLKDLSEEPNNFFYYTKDLGNFPVNSAKDGNLIDLNGAVLLGSKECAAATDATTPLAAIPFEIKAISTIGQQGGGNPKEDEIDYKTIVYNVSLDDILYRTLDTEGIARSKQTFSRTHFMTINTIKSV